MATCKNCGGRLDKHNLSQLRVCELEERTRAERHLQQLLQSDERVQLENYLTLGKGDR